MLSFSLDIKERDNALSQAQTALSKARTALAEATQALDSSRKRIKELETSLNEDFEG